MNIRSLAISCLSFFLMNCNNSNVVDSNNESFDPQSLRINPEDEVYKNSDEIVLKKGQVIPKGTYILKPGETKADFGAAGPYDLSGLAKAVATGTPTITGLGEYQNIYLIAGTTSGVTCPDGQKLNLDLNRGSGGYWIFLCASTSGGRIQPSSIRTFALSSLQPPANSTFGFNGVGLSNSDMNQNAAGKFVHGYYNLWGGNCGVDGIGVRYKDHWWEFIPSVPGGWRGPSNDADLNTDAGGAWIYFIFRTGAANCWG